MHTTMCFLGMAFWFPIFFYLGRVRWETAPNKLRDEGNKMVLCLQNRNRSVLRWALLLPETGIAVPAALASGLACFPRGRRARETQKRAYMSDLRAILRSISLLAAVGSVAAGIRDSCSGYAGFQSWLLYAGLLSVSLSLFLSVSLSLFLFLLLFLSNCARTFYEISTILADGFLYVLLLEHTIQKYTYMPVVPHKALAEVSKIGNP